MLKLTLIVAAVVGVLLAVLRATVVDTWKLPGDDASLLTSVRPALAAGDLLVVSKESVPEVGSLARCVDPDAPERFVVARVMAESNEHITINGGIVQNGRRRIPSPRRCDPPIVEVNTKEGGVLPLDCWFETFADVTFESLRGGPDSPMVDKQVPAGQLYLVSDNRMLHLDSRDYGPVERQTCRRIYMILWGDDGISDLKLRWLP